MLERIQTWLVVKRIELVAEMIGECLSIDRAVMGGTELCEEECEALRAGIVAGLLSACEVVKDTNADDLEDVAVRTYKAAARAYGQYLKEAENDED